jgi:hypothetical protein
VYGVKAVANDISVRPRDGQKRTDTEIAEAALSALKWNAMVPNERLTITVNNGWLTLAGQVDWSYERVAAGRAVRDLSGVTGVTNSIAVTTRERIGRQVEDRIGAEAKRRGGRPSDQRVGRGWESDPVRERAFVVRTE